MVREIFYYKNYYLDFFETLKPEVKKKFNWTLGFVSTLERIPKKYFEHLTGTDGVYEIKVEVGGDIFRVFSCFDKGNVIILFNGFQKKTQKTPKSEIDMAVKLKNEYFNEKDK